MLVGKLSVTLFAATTSGFKGTCGVLILHHFFNFLLINWILNKLISRNSTFILFVILVSVILFAVAPDLLIISLEVFRRDGDAHQMVAARFVFILWLDFGGIFFLFILYLLNKITF